jgi:DNA-directed RNA polymerase alpha subunit
MEEGRTINSIGLEPRTCRMLRQAGIETAEELSRLNPDSLIKIRGMGKKAMEEILERMKENGMGEEECKS